MKLTTAMAPRATPTPIPAFAPVERVLAEPVSVAELMVPVEVPEATGSFVGPEEPSTSRLGEVVMLDADSEVVVSTYTIASGGQC